MQPLKELLVESLGHDILEILLQYQLQYCHKCNDSKPNWNTVYKLPCTFCFDMCCDCLIRVLLLETVHCVVLSKQKSLRGLNNHLYFVLIHFVCYTLVYHIYFPLACVPFDLIEICQPIAAFVIKTNQSQSFLQPMIAASKRAAVYISPRKRGRAMNI